MQKNRPWPEGGIEVGELLRVKPQAAEGTQKHIIVSICLLCQEKTCGNYGFSCFLVAGGEVIFELFSHYVGIIDACVKSIDS